MSGFEVIRQFNDKGNQGERTLKLNRTKLEPVLLAKFEGNVEQALQFYSSQVSKLTFQNNTLSSQLRNALQEKKELADFIAAYREQEREEQEDSKKRVRRCANEIQRDYICPVAGCEKSYGTEGSMAQHMKFKHPNFHPKVKPNRNDKEESGNSSEVKHEKLQEVSPRKQ